MASSLSTARTEFEVTFNDFTKTTTYPVSIDVAFTANAKKLTVKARDRSEEGGITIKGSSTVNSRSADALANIVVDGVPLFDGEPSTTAPVASGEAKSKTIDRTG